MFQAHSMAAHLSHVVPHRIPHLTPSWVQYRLSMHNTISPPPKYTAFPSFWSLSTTISIIVWLWQGKGLDIVSWPRLLSGQPRPLWPAGCLLAIGEVASRTVEEPHTTSWCFPQKIRWIPTLSFALPPRIHTDGIEQGSRQQKPEPQHWADLTLRILREPRKMFLFYQNSWVSPKQKKTLRRP